MTAREKVDSKSLATNLAPTSTNQVLHLLCFWLLLDWADLFRLSQPHLVSSYESPFETRHFKLHIGKLTPSQSLPALSVSVGCALPADGCTSSSKCLEKSRNIMLADMWPFQEPRILVCRNKALLAYEALVCVHAVCGFYSLQRAEHLQQILHDSQPEILYIWFFEDNISSILSDRKGPIKVQATY